MVGGSNPVLQCDWSVHCRCLKVKGKGIYILVQYPDNSSLDFTYYLPRYWSSLLHGLIPKRKTALLIFTLCIHCSKRQATITAWLPGTVQDENLAQVFTHDQLGNEPLTSSSLTIGPQLLLSGRQVLSRVLQQRSFSQDLVLASSQTQTPQLCRKQKKPLISTICLPGPSRQYPQ